MELQRAKAARADLDTGGGVYHRHEAGRAVRDLHAAQAAGERARWEAEHAPRWRERRAAAKQAATWAEREADARERCQTHVAPEAARLDADIQRSRRPSPRLVARAEKQRVAYRATIDTMIERSHEARDLSRVVRGYQDRLDGIQTTPPQPSTRVAQPRPAAVIPPHPTPQPPRPGISM